MPTGHASLMPALRRVVLGGTAADRTDGQLLGAFVAATGGGLPQSQEAADAFGLLVRRHGPMVMSVCRRVVCDHHGAEDAFQAVFIVLARRAASVEPRDLVGNWLYGVAYRTALKARAVLARRRSREKQVLVMPDAAAQNSGSPDEWADLQPVIDEELARLPEKLRAPVVLCDLEGRPQREVAKSLGVPPATLATRLASARRTLAQRLTKRGVTLSGGAVGGLLTSHGATAAVPVALAVGLTRAAEAVAAGTTYSGLVSASAAQLSEGVMRMMLLTKLKLVAVVALTAASLTCGLGLGLVPASAGGSGDGPTPAGGAARLAPPTKAAEPPTPKAEAREVEVRLEAETPADDATFLRRMSLDLRGTPPTAIETFFFVSDEDDAKRAKLVQWLVDDEDTRAHLAQRFGGKPVRLRIVKQEGGDGKPLTLTLVPEVVVPDVKGVAFTPDGRRLIAEQVQPRIDALVGEKWVEWKDVVRARTERLVAAADDKPASTPAKRGVRVRSVPAGEVLWSVVEDNPPEAGAPRLFRANGQETVRVWDAATGQPAGGGQDAIEAKERLLEQRSRVLIAGAALAESDLDFLKRVTTAARGSGPTSLEERYFTEDKDPRKREKLLDSLLKEPGVAKKLGDDFKKKMLAGPPQDAKRFWLWLAPQELNFDFTIPAPGVQLDPNGLRFAAPPNAKPGEGLRFTIPAETKPTPPKTLAPPAPVMPSVPPAAVKPPVPPKPPAASPTEKFGKLVDALVAAKKTDAELLEAVTLAAAGRLPTDSEKRLTLGLVAKAADKRAAWVEVARAIAGVDDEVRIELRIVRPEAVPPAKP